ncbi:MAG: hypothetical protein AAF654_12600 [Myxococcota bacterium]
MDQCTREFIVSTARMALVGCDDIGSGPMSPDGVVPDDVTSVSGDTGSSSKLTTTLEDLFGSGALTTAGRESKNGRTCFARNMHRYLTEREEVAADNCNVQSRNDVLLASSTPVVDLVVYALRHDDLFNKVIDERSL